jgi:hypothetical protein
MVNEALKHWNDDTKQVINFKLTFFLSYFVLFFCLLFEFYFNIVEKA